jgi:hypothetical protein
LLQHAGAEVAAAGAEPRVAEPVHDLDDDLGDPGEVHAALPRAVAEAIAGQRYHHHIEGVGAGGEQRNDGQHLHERARPAVQQYQRQAGTVDCSGV